MAERRFTAGRLACPWCPRHVWVEAVDGRRAVERAYGRLSEHAHGAHRRSSQELLAAMEAKGLLDG